MSSDVRKKELIIIQVHEFQIKDLYSLNANKCLDNATLVLPGPHLCLLTPWVPGGFGGLLQ